MNKAYRLIWSRVKEAWVVVSEKVTGKGGPRAATVTLSAALLLAAGSASALPTGSQIVSGSAGIVTNGSNMTVTNSANAIINWQAFSIANGETTRFIQPSAVSAVLNRVTGGDPSKILGTLQSNGKVLLINPSGIIFGVGSRVDVNGLIASSLDIANQDFLAGRMKFTAGATTGKIENQGTITTPSGGSVYLIAPDVQNSGVITAPNGDVLLAAGKEVLLVDSANPEIAMVVTAPDGQSINLGTIVANAGRVGMYGSVVRQQGRISADSAVKDASGRIFFKATKEAALEAGSVTTANGPQGGSVTVQASEGTSLLSGSVEAKGAEGAGGTVQLLGQQVGLIDNAVIDASGTTGGGTVLIGGDYQGKNPLVQNAEATYMGKDATIKADATDNGDGGKVIVWSDNVTRVFGGIYALGGANGGDGGLVETSGKNYLDVNGISINALAPKGNQGNWLLDPIDIIVLNTTPDYNLLTEVDQFADTTVGSGWITPATIEAASSNVILQATNGITVSSPINMTNVGVGITAQAGGDITINAPVTTKGGAISLIANDPAYYTGWAALSIGAGGGLDTTGGGNLPAGANITLTNTGLGGITIAGSANSGSAGINMFSDAGKITTTAPLTVMGAVTLGSNSIWDNSGTLDISGSGYLNLLTGSEFNNLAAGVITLTGTSIGPVSGAGILNNVGTLNKTTTTVQSISSAFNNTGTVNVSSSTLILNGTDTQAGVLNVASSATLALSGTQTLNSGVDFTDTGNVTLGGTINLAIPLTFGGSDPALTLLGTTINGSATNIFTTSANTSVTGAVTLGTSSIWDNTGTLDVNSGGYIFLNTSSQLNNQSGGFITLTGTSSSPVQGVGILNNVGTLNKTTTTAQTISSAFSNSGTVNVSSSTLILNGTDTQAGVLNVASSATLALSGTQTLNSGVDFTDTGNVTLGGTINLAIPLTFGGSDPALTLLGTTINGSATNIFTTSANTSVTGAVTLGTSSIWDNTGTLDVNSGGYIFLNTSSQLNNQSGGFITLTGTSSSPVQGVGILNNVGTLNKTTTTAQSISSAFSNSGTVNVDPGVLAISSTFTQSGTLNVASGAIINRAVGFTNTGTISGSGTITVGTGAAKLTNQGSINPGGSETAGTLAITGDLQLDTGSNLNIDLGGTIAGTGYDLLTVSGAATMGGTLTGSLINDFIPSGQSFDVINAVTATGSFTTSTLPSGINGAIVGNIYRLTHTGGSCSGICWDGGASTTNWADADNWTGDALPSSTDVAYLNLVAGVTVDLASSQTIKGLNADANNHLKINSGGALTLLDGTTTSSLLGNLTINIGGTLTANGTTSLAALNLASGTLNGSGSLSITNSFTRTGGTVGSTFTGVIINQVSGTLSPGAWSVNGPISLVASTGDISLSGNIGSTSSYVGMQASQNLYISTMSGASTISGAGVKLEASYIQLGEPGYNAGSISATSGNGISLIADTFYATTTPVSSITSDTGIAIQTLTNGREIAVGTGATGAGLVLNDVSTTLFNTPKLRIGNENTSGTYGASSGNITVGGTGITRSGLLALTTNGAIVQSVGAPIIVNSLGLISGTAKDIILTESTNDVPNLAAKSGGLFSFTDAAASLSLISMTTGSPAAAVNGVTATGATIITTTGSIVDGVTTVPAITAPNVSLTTQTGIGSSATPVKTQASNLFASSSTAGGIYIINSVPLTLQAASANGDIVVTNTGAVIAATVGALTSSSGSVSLTAHSPLTISSYGVSAATGVNLTAGSGGSSSPSDLLTINGPVTTTTGTILLAGNAVTGSNVPASATKLVYTPPPPPDPTPVPPTIGECTANPSLSGCSAVLPSIETCTATPSAPGCSVVLPSLSTCTSAPTTPGCGVVLPSIATCTSDPTTPGCSVVLPSLATCTATPSVPGCTVVLPSLASCIASPSTPGCLVVLPSIATCSSNPASAGCSVVLPSLATCIASPGTVGCSVVLPGIISCIAAPSTPGCAVVLPTLADCAATPSALGCVAVVPVAENRFLAPITGQVINSLDQVLTTPVAPAGLQLIAQTPAASDTPTSQNGGGNNSDDKDKNKENSGQQPAGGGKNDDKPKKNYCN